MWLQAGPYYADSRGFAGTTSFDGSQVRFHHLTGEPGEDAGTFRWDGANLVERGTNPDGSTFLEIWTPCPRPTARAAPGPARTTTWCVSATTWCTSMPAPVRTGGCDSPARAPRARWATTHLPGERVGPLTRHVIRSSRHGRSPAGRYSA